MPAAPPPYLAVPKSFTSVQLVPFQVSVIAIADPGEPCPPEHKADVYVPTPEAPYLPVFKSFTSVQLVPS